VFGSAKEHTSTDPSELLTVDDNGIISSRRVLILIELCRLHSGGGALDSIGGRGLSMRFSAVILLCNHVRQIVHIHVLSTSDVTSSWRYKVCNLSTHLGLSRPLKGARRHKNDRAYSTGI